MNRSPPKKAKWFVQIRHCQQYSDCSCILSVGVWYVRHFYSLYYILLYCYCFHLNVQFVCETANNTGN